MGKGLLVQGGGGGTSSDDLTAKKKQVLEGYTAVTNDSNDEAIEGGMKNLTDRAKITHTTDNNIKVVLGDAAYISTNSDGTTRAEIRYNGDEGFITPNTLIAIDQGSMATAGNLTAAKIAKGENAFGINGTYTSDANATADKILTGFSGYVNGFKVDGSMSNQETKTASLNCGGSYIIPKGFHNGNGKVTANSLSSQTDATATAPYIYKGKTAWVKGNKLTGTLTTTSAINFSAAARSYNTIRISWTNPSKGPWSGVFIQMSTSGNPGTGGGTRAYTGKGINGSQAGGNNYVDITGLNYETKYYFTCTSYVHFNEINHDEWGVSYNINATTTRKTPRTCFSDITNGTGLYFDYMDYYGGKYYMCYRSCSFIDDYTISINGNKNKNENLENSKFIRKDGANWIYWYGIGIIYSSGVGAVQKNLSSESISALKTYKYKIVDSSGNLIQDFGKIDDLTNTRTAGSATNFYYNYYLLLSSTCGDYIIKKELNGCKIVFYR